MDRSSKAVQLDQMFAEYKKPYHPKKPNLNKLSILLKEVPSDVLIKLLLKVDSIYGHNVICAAAVMGHTDISIAIFSAIPPKLREDMLLGCPFMPVHMSVAYHWTQRGPQAFFEQLTSVQLVRIISTWERRWMDQSLDKISVKTCDTIIKVMKECRETAEKRISRKKRCLVVDENTVLSGKSARIQVTTESDELMTSLMEENALLKDQVGDMVAEISDLKTGMAALRQANYLTQKGFTDSISTLRDDAEALHEEMTDSQEQAIYAREEIWVHVNGLEKSVDKLSHTVEGMEEDVFPDSNAGGRGAALDDYPLTTSDDELEINARCVAAQR